LRHLKENAKAVASFLELEKKSDKYRQEARYLLAELYREMGQLSEASRWYEAVGLIKGKYGAHALLAKAQMQFEKSQLELSYKTLKFMFREFPESEVEWDGRLLLAEVAFEGGRLDEARQSYAVVIERGVGKLKESALYGRAWVYFDQEKYDLALLDLDHLIKTYPNSPFRESSLQLKGQIYMQTNRIEEARDIFSLGASADAGGEAMLMNLATVETELKNYDRALEVYNQILAKYPSPETQGRVMYEKGWLYMEMGRSNEALLVFKAYRNSYPNGELVSDVDFALGQLAYDRDAYAEAVVAYGNSAQAPRYMDKSLYKLGFCHFKMNDFGKAAEAFSRLVNQVPDSPLAIEGRYREGQSWLKFNDVSRAEKALVAYLQVARSDRFMPDASFDLGVVYEKQGKSAQAIDQYERYLKVYTSGERVIEAKVYLARMYMASRSFSKARDVLKSALKDRTHFLALEAQYLEGEAFYQEGRYDEAIRSFLLVQRYKDGDKWRSEGLLKVALSHKALGRMDRAQQYLDKVIDRFSGSEAGQKAVEVLRTLKK
jgi:TolA-binding protein